MNYGLCICCLWYWWCDVLLADLPRKHKKSMHFLWPCTFSLVWFFHFWIWTSCGDTFCALKTCAQPVPTCTWTLDLLWISTADSTLKCRWGCYSDIILTRHSKQRNTRTQWRTSNISCSFFSQCGCLLNKEASFVWEYENIEKMAGLCIKSFIAEEVTILLTSQRTAVFPPLSPESVC